MQVMLSIRHNSGWFVYHTKLYQCSYLMLDFQLIQWNWQFNFINHFDLKFINLEVWKLTWYSEIASSLCLRAACPLASVSWTFMVIPFWFVSSFCAAVSTRIHRSCFLPVYRQQPTSVSFLYGSISTTVQPWMLFNRVRNNQYTKWAADKVDLEFKNLVKKGDPYHLMPNIFAVFLNICQTSKTFLHN